MALKTIVNTQTNPACLVVGYLQGLDGESLLVG